MRSLLYFLMLFAVALGAVAALTWPAWLAVTPFIDVPFHRVGNRVALLALGLGLWFVARRTRVASRAGMGFGAPASRFLRQLVVGFAWGVAFMVPLAAIMIALGLRDVNTDPRLSQIAALVGAGLLSGLSVALIEETFLRGAMFSAVSRDAGVVAAVLSTSAIYAAIHFFARYRIPASEAYWGSGFDLVAGSLRALATPALIRDAFLSLAAVGALLAVVRHWTGNIASCIGLHAGWVTVMLTTVRYTTVDPDADYAWLLSRHDGFVGWLVLGWCAIAAIPMLLYYRRA
jgi:uncharacterized protein